MGIIPRVPELPAMQFRQHEMVRGDGIIIRILLRNAADNSLCAEVVDAVESWRELGLVKGRLLRLLLEQTEEDGGFDQWLSCDEDIPQCILVVRDGARHFEPQQQPA